MFSAVYGEKSAEVRSILHGVQCPSTGRVEELLAQPKLGLAELGELLEIGRYEAAVDQFELLRGAVMQRWLLRQPEGHGAAPADARRAGS
jgi:hypothetical protein